MPIITAPSILSRSRHLALVVVFLCTALFSLSQPACFLSPAPYSVVATTITKKPLFSCKAKELKGKLSAAKVPGKRVSLEAALTFIHITFQSQIIAWQIFGPAYFFVSQQPGISFYAPRLFGISFTSRIFFFTIQPNGP